VNSNIGRVMIERGFRRHPSIRNGNENRMGMDVDGGGRGVVRSRDWTTPERDAPVARPRRHTIPDLPLLEDGAADGGAWEMAGLIGELDDL